MGEYAVDPATTQWREDFDRRFGEESERMQGSLLKIEGLLTTQNNRVRKNEVAIAKIQTWVTLIGSVTGLIGIATALLQAVK